jgi:hypothetical protein
MFLNEYDLESIRHDVEPFERPNLAHAAVTVLVLAGWTNRNSDGWAYWPKPGRAAKRLAEHLYHEYLGRYDQRTGEDISDAELAAGNRTVKAFLTRLGVEQEWRNGALCNVADVSR